MDSNQYQQIIKVAADSPAHLRAGDLQRVFYEAEDQGVNLSEFAAWLRGQDLPDRTRRRLDTFTH